MTARVVIVGASLAGATAAEALRTNGFKGTITVVGDEPYAPYNRPPLSKEALVGRVDAADTQLPLPLSRKSVDWRHGVAATSLDTATRVVTLADGSALPYDKLLIATGTRARSWPVPEEAAFTGLLTVRGRADAAQLRIFLDEQPARVVIVGGGFMGAEMAASCRQRGVEVTLVDRGPAPLAGALGATIAAQAAALHRQNGVDLRCNASVKQVRADANRRVCGVTLDDGTHIDTTLVIAALGAIPNTEWLNGSSIGADPKGVACDAGCRAFSADKVLLDDVYVAGDVARFAQGDGFVRLEHWDNAVAMAQIAAHNMLCAPDQRHSHVPVPAFWSTQYDTNIKSLGTLAGADHVVLTEGAMASGEFVAVYGKDGFITGVVAFNGGRTLPSYARLLADTAPFPPQMRTNNPPPEVQVLPAGFKERAK